VTERLQSIQALRFIAAAMVVYNHAAELARASTGRYGCLATHNVSALGAAGVDIFFVISGLVIALTGPLASPMPSGALFFWRRWRRVAPIFFLLTIPTLMAFSVKGPMSPYGAGGPMNTPQTVATILFWPATTDLIVPPYLSQGWTLSLEMLFYLAVSFVLLGGKIRQNLLVLAGVLAIVVWSRWTYKTSYERVLANRMFLEFGFGVALAFVLPKLRRVPTSYCVPLLATAAIFYLCIAVVGDRGAAEWRPTLSDEGTGWRVFALGTPALCIVSAALILERKFSGRMASVLVSLGDASYSIYLVHALVLLGLWLLWRAIGAPPPWIVIVVSMVAAIAVGVAVQRVVERPLLRWIRGWRPQVWSVAR
jgi:exopolysaccharide production protein ExoZ